MSYPLAKPLAGASGGADGTFGLRYRTGLVEYWDPTTGANTIKVDGVSRTNLPVLPGAISNLVRKGDPVTLLTTTDDHGVVTYLVAGVPIQPPDSRLWLDIGGGEAPPPVVGGGATINLATHIPSINSYPGGTDPTAADASGSYTTVVGAGSYDLVIYEFFYYFDTEGTDVGPGTIYSVSCPRVPNTSHVVGPAWVMSNGNMYPGWCQPDGTGGVCVVTGADLYPVGPGNWPGGSFVSGNRFGGTITFTSSH